MTLTPEQKNAGWIEWNGGECPIKDARTVVRVITNDYEGPDDREAQEWRWDHDGTNNIIAYRITEAHGADAEPARPTPFPTGYHDLVFDPATKMSQTFIVDGKRPEWLRDEDWCSSLGDPAAGTCWHPSRHFERFIAIRVRRREPKRETVECRLLFTNGSPLNDQRRGTIDLIDGEPDLSTLKIGGEV